MTCREPSEDGREAVLTISRDGKVLGKATFVKAAEREFEVRDADGKLTGKVVRTPRGDLRLTDARGTILRTLPAEEIASVRGI
jgi:hypothetical protein